LSTQINEGTFLGALWENNKARRLICTSCLSILFLNSFILLILNEWDTVVNNSKKFKMLSAIKKHTLSLKTYKNSVFLVKCKVKQKNSDPLPQHILHKNYDT